MGFKPDRIHAGKPTNSIAHIKCFIDNFSAVAFKCHMINITAKHLKKANCQGAK
jgi:hypothetical protein